MALHALDFLADLLLPFRVQNHGKDKAVQGPTDGEDGDGAEHADGVRGLGILETERARTLLGFLALKVSAGVADVGGSLVHFLADVLHQTLPQFLFLLATEADGFDGGIQPFGKATEEGHQVGNWA